ncbi:hypothetical protein HFP89_13860 [Wenzhouxiangella sp. XN79A]|uniref:hypothetical protein n=1 Tax=Wenzhouxiangella sp. XN79A TaxID=2724193 RepID=UPI00144AC9AB|nr:hypothetical protein [Wenzhouxiangella sp. XN79A]NKI36251.1 hypothetical protein [Wenzhouxiangella sp. XN79A]
MNRIPLLAVLGILVLPAFVAADTGTRESSAIWSTWSGAGHFELRADYLQRTELEILVDGQPIEGAVRVPVRIRDLGSISIYAPNGNFEDFDDGRLDLATDIVLRYRDREVSLESLVATGFTNKDHPALRISDGKGRHLLTVAHPHVIADQDKQLLTIHNADLWATDTLADALDFEPLAGYPIGMAWLDLNLYIPPDADLSGISPPRGGLSCTGRPQWPQQSTAGNLFEVDVELINIGQVVAQDQSFEPVGQVKVAPSATLKSVSDSGDAVWIPKFSSNGLWPYTPEDQHPYLVWNMYRIHDGRIEQIGASGVKHAFLTLNFNCTINCGSGNVLWPGCEDVYGTGTNNSNSNQGPRYDINPASGLFISSPSFFDPNNSGSQSNSSSAFENRLVVPDVELEVPGAEYFLDSWYVVMHDIDIWNSMGYHRLNPNESGGLWTFGPLGPFTNGPLISEWVPEGTTDPLESHVSIKVPSSNPLAQYPNNMPQGHVRVLAKATETAPGRWRYNYAIQNYDFDRNIDEVRIPLPASAEVFETFFGAPVTDGHQTLDWAVQRVGGELVFTAPPPTSRPAPAPPASNDLTWFSLFNFEVETDVPPIEAAVTLGVAEAGSPSELSAAVVAPGLLEAIFFDGFETP